MSNRSIDRRQFLNLAGLVSLGTASACASAAPSPSEAPSEQPAKPSNQPVSIATQLMTPNPPAIAGMMQKKRVLRIAHLTDFHVQPEGIATKGMVRALRHAQGQADPAEIIFNTGDAIMDSLEANKARTEAQWEVFNNILTEECHLPVVHAIGNHDVWGWGLPDRQVQNDPRYGKAMAIEKLSLSGRYYSFNQSGWHFIVLDSNHLPNEVSQHPYIGKLDEEQFQWLVKDVEAVSGSTPICIVSHIPILAACEYFDGFNEASGNWVVPAAWMHIDARRLRQFFLQHPNIRLCLSGHTHQHEMLDYLGVRYLTNGAVSGNWWQGAYLDFPPAYVLVDLFEDGTSQSLFVPYEAG